MTNQPAEDRADGVLAEIREEIREIPEEIAEVATAAREEFETTRLGQWSIDSYLWVMDHAPTSTRGRLLMATAIFLIVLAPSLLLLYFSLAAGQAATESWFGQLGYAGVFLANLASTATLFIPVPGLTAAAQALIASSSATLSPFWVGVLGGLGMAIGEITAYVAGMAASFIAKEEEIKPPRRLQSLIDRITRGVAWLMDHYGMPTLLCLSAIP